MTDIEIRRVTGMEYYTQARKVAGYAFRASPAAVDTSNREEELPFLEKARAYVVFDGGEPLATATLFPYVQNVRGKLLSMSGVGGVATMPAARRKGHIRRIFAELFESMRDNDEVVSVLYPFRESFYEKLGYAAMTQAKFIRFAPSALASLSRIEKQGNVEQVMIADGFDDWRAYLQRYQSHVHGFALAERSVALGERHRNRDWLALARDPEGVVIGGMTFRITGYGEQLEAGDFYYDSPEARLLLLDWFARHVDQVSEIKVRVAVTEMPELWVPDLYAKVRNHDVFFTAPMGRVMDMTALSGISAGPGEIAIEVLDAQCPWNAGVYALASDASGVLTVERGGNPAASITIQGLSALVFAGHDPAAFRLRGWGDPDAASQATLRSLFPAIAAYVHEDF
jgi:predicted acetyltransferase